MKKKVSLSQNFNLGCVYIPSCEAHKHCRVEIAQYRLEIIFKSQENSVKITAYFLWLSQKSTSNLNLMTKWKTYLIWMQNFKSCLTLQGTFYIVFAGLRPPSSKHVTLLPFVALSKRIMGR